MGTESEPVIQEATEESNSISDLEQKIIRQIEHYFGNYNLSKDKFLKEQIALDNGWIPMETMVKFNRLKSLSEDFEVIVSALKKSPNQLMEVNEDNTKIRRREDKPLPESYLKHEPQDIRSLYVKGFKKTATLDQLLDFFRSHKAEYVCMRRVKGPTKTFKGSCFVMFETVEDAEKFLNLKGIKYEGMELLREKKLDYVARKDEQFAQLRLEKEAKAARRKENQNNEKDSKNSVKETKTTEVTEPEIVLGCLLKITGLGPESTREHLWDVLKPLGEIAFTDYSKGKTEAIIRFETGIAAEIFEKASEEDGERKMQFGDVKGTLTVLAGEEETLYWKSIAVSKANSRQRFSQYNKQQNRGRFKKNWGKKSRGFNKNRGDDNSESSSKRKTQETDADSEPSSKRKTEDAGADSEPASKRKPEEAVADSEPPSKKVKGEANNANEPSSIKVDS